MKTKWILIVQIFVIYYIEAQASNKRAKPIVEHKQDAKFDNPGQIRDRLKNEIAKPEMPTRWVERFKQPYSSFWMDYCAPYHCAHYNKQMCGLNRKKMKFRFFQSGCHIALHNYCAKPRGQLKYDPVDLKFCAMYVMYLRIGCPRTCDEVPLDPICGIDNSNHPVIFVNECAMDMENCKRKDDSVYEEVHMNMCAYFLKHGAILPPTSIQLSMDGSHNDESVENNIIA